MTYKSDGGGSRGRTTSPGKGLAQGAGEINALKPKENFDGRPHLDLIERLEKATGPDRELDAAIWRGVRGGEVWSYNENSHIDFSISRGTWKGAREDHPDFDPGADALVTWRYHIGESGTTSSEYGEVPQLTGSIDAALTLVEKDAAWAVSHSPDEDPEGYPKPFRATVMPALRYSGRSDATDHADHPAIALCIAALKARASQDPPERA